MTREDAVACACASVGRSVARRVQCVFSILATS